MTKKKEVEEVVETPVEEVTDETQEFSFDEEEVLAEKEVIEETEDVLEDEEEVLGEIKLENAPEEVEEEEEVEEPHVVVEPEAYVASPLEFSAKNEKAAVKRDAKVEENKKTLAYLKVDKEELEKFLRDNDAEVHYLFSDNVNAARIILEIPV